MHNKYRLFSATLIIVLVSFSAIAQKRTFSPYSRYGLGEMQDGGFGRNAAMGRTGIALSNSTNLNNMNPASYHGMDSLSFFFEGGLIGFQQKLQTDEATSEMSDMNFAYFAVGFPVAKWGFMSVGVEPTSLVGYDFYDDNIQSDSNPNGYPSYDGKYSTFTTSGEGNTSKAYVGLALSPVKNLSVGAHFSYMFGNIRHSSLVQFPNDAVASKLGTSMRIQINDIFMDFGAQYKLDLNEKHSLTFGGIYNPKTGIGGKVTRLVAEGNTLESEGKMVIAVDTLHYDENKLTGNAFEMPEKYGFGVAYNIKDALTLTADYTLAKWSEAKFPDDNTTTADMEKWAFGAEFIPNERSARFYPARIRYRLGTYYKNDYLILNDHQLKDFGISFGVGLPLKRSKTSLNVAFEWGQRGTTDYKLVKETYGKVTVNLTLHENWFFKQKFD
ncbi:hypothetical protein [Carboxylicivirga sp. N1Y90]|uniref:hypothetical protein n=1 Tax=Carboxylicivirga fragile TaxID=3417571 RepID=UPI003D35087E|nr:hypothetical protein [Marinilabiliaceae bacterium N1Y90]